jgi:teichuronic acid biosynthesis glycosyltransferase TuaC
MSRLKLAVITGDYPSKQQPHVGTFVQQITQAMAQQGTQITVIAPRVLAPGRWHRYSQLAPDENEARITVLRPLMLSFSNRSLPWVGSTYRWSVWSFARTIQAVGRRLHPVPDCCYGHFLYPAGVAAANLAKLLGIPSVVALGESWLPYYESQLEPGRIRNDVAGFAGIIAVSEVNRSYCINQFGAPPRKVMLLPNAVDISLFYPRDRQKSRERHGLPQDRPIVAFVGHFNKRKGPLRLMEALKTMPEVGAIFLGAGSQVPTGSQVLFAGPVPHAEIPEWLSTADLFVLPTLAEGSSNALLEAMACGLPVVTSDRPFNHEMLDNTVACLVDPCDIAAISGAIRELLIDTNRRQQMREAALARARRYTLQDRAELILSWIEEIIRARR